jgi:hypothetical protein
LGGWTFINEQMNWNKMKCVNKGGWNGFVNWNLWGFEGSCFLCKRSRKVIKKISEHTKDAKYFSEHTKDAKLFLNTHKMRNFFMNTQKMQKIF